MHLVLEKSKGLVSEDITDFIADRTAKTRCCDMLRRYLGAIPPKSHCKTVTKITPTSPKIDLSFWAKRLTALKYRAPSVTPQQRTGCLRLMTPTWWAVAFVGIILRNTLFQEILKRPVPDTVNIWQGKKQINENRYKLNETHRLQTRYLLLRRILQPAFCLLTSVNQESLQLLLHCSCPPRSLLTEAFRSCS